MNMRSPSLTRVRLNRDLLLGLLIVLLFVVVALAAPMISPPNGPDEPSLIPANGFSSIPLPPDALHPLGTLPLRQYDVLYGIVWGSRVAFQIGLSITLGRALIGVLVGLAAGYAGGWWDAVLMRITDAFTGFPIVAAAGVMLLVFSGIIGGGGGGAQASLTLALIVFGWMRYARLIRGSVLAERAKEYVTAAMAVGVRMRRIMFRHVLPNVVSKGLFVLIASDIGTMVVLMATFNFLGLFIMRGDQPLADWGYMLSVSRSWIVSPAGSAFRFWYTYLPPSISIILFAAGWNLLESVS